jgi:hypothetical protein
LGIDWAQRNSMNKESDTAFFMNESKTREQENLFFTRVIQFAEMLLNLQFVPGFNEIIRKIKTEMIEPYFAELEVGKLLVMHQIPFRYVQATGHRGESYDLEFLFNGRPVFGDTKCKLEASQPSEKSIFNTLHSSRSQLPQSGPGVFFVKIPQSWSENWADDQLIQTLKSAADQFLRGTGRVDSVIFFINRVLEIDSQAASLLLLVQRQNLRRRDGLDWTIFGDIDGYDCTLGALEHPDWINIVSLCL